jgi:cell wall-associated NlpC family hydrolase
LTAHDKRLHAIRPDLADERLRGQVSSDRFVAGRPAHIVVPVANVLKEPSADAGLSTQLQLGESVTVFDETGGWAWVQGGFDGYVGYVEAGSIGNVGAPATHVVRVPRTFIYSGPDLKLPHRASLSMGASVAVTGSAETRGTRYAVLASGEAIIAEHLAPRGHDADDFVAVAEMLALTPYLWGGCTGFGIDCSGLVQLSMRMAGRKALRDSDMQAETLGEPIEPGGQLRRGDLVFWKGHVAIMTDPETILHANGHTMMVSRERLADAVDRIGYLYGTPTGYRRP